MVDSMDAFKAQEAGRAEAAAEDLRRIEQEVTAEAEASVEDFDAMGKEQDAAFAAETAQTFEEAANAN